MDGVAGLPRLQPRQAGVRIFRTNLDMMIDQGLALWFPEPASFTGEDCAEFHVHGGSAVIEAMVERLTELNARPAEAGEFTRRAFQNGKMDLTEAEGLADLIDAQTEGQRIQALSQMRGALRNVYEGWREALISILARIEGEVDFPDEGDVPETLSDTASTPLADLICALADHLQDGHRGERVREGFSIALIGEPNVGKSTLLNVLARREAAIVTDIPGTTRDVVEIHLVLGGFPVIIADTAGLCDASDRVEAEGVRRALKAAESADLRIGVADVSRETFDANLLKTLRTGDALVLNKLDRGQKIQPLDEQGITCFMLSAKSGSGAPKLEAWLEDEVIGRLSGHETPALSRARHRQAVEQSLFHLKSAATQLDFSPELAASDVHLAIRALEGLTGHIDVEDVLDRVFSQFCIGK